MTTRPAPFAFVAAQTAAAFQDADRANPHGSSEKQDKSNFATPHLSLGKIITASQITNVKHALILVSVKCE